MRPPARFSGPQTASMSEKTVGYSESYGAPKYSPQSTSGFSAV
jgi:hypothetical protein